MPNALADPELAKRVEKARELIGAKELEELARVLAGAGYLKPPDSPFDLETTTIGEVGRDLYEQIKDDAAPGFRKLMPGQKAAVACWLVHEGQSTIHVAAELGVPLQSVQRLWARHCRDIGKDVVALQMDALVGNVVARAEHLYELAMKPDDKGRMDLKTAWAVTRETIVILQSLGIVTQRAQEVKLSVDVTVQSEIDKLMVLEEKRRETDRHVEVVSGRLDNQAGPEDGRQRADADADVSELPEDGEHARSADDGGGDEGGAGRLRGASPEVSGG